jgi:hypothetical protein
LKKLGFGESANGGLQGIAIASGAKSTDHANGFVRKIGMMSEGFTSMHI